MNSSGYIYAEDKKFKNRDFSEEYLPKGEYEYCIFSKCDFSGSDLSGVKFIECEFIECNISNAKLYDTSFQRVEFKNCKMLGLHFNRCNEFGMSLKFEGSTLSHSIFFQLSLKQTIFRDSQLTEVDFSECNLSEVVFDNCDLAGAAFSQTTLKKADLSTAYNYRMDPEHNSIEGARFSQSGLAGLLDKYNINIDY